MKNISQLAALFAAALITLTSGCASDPKPQPRTAVWLQPPPQQTSITVNQTANITNVTQSPVTQSSVSRDTVVHPLVVATNMAEFIAPRSPLPGCEKPKVVQPPAPVIIQQVIINPPPAQPPVILRSAPGLYQVEAEDPGGYWINVPLPQGASGVFQNRVWVPDRTGNDRRVFPGNGGSGDYQGAVFR